MATNQRQPLGIELVRRGIVKQEDIREALEYQKTHTKEKLGDILNDLKLANPRVLLDAMGEILGEKVFYLTETDVKIDVTRYISLDIAKEANVVPFEVQDGIIKVCFSDISNKQQVETVRLIMLNKGLVMERYITFKANIEEVLSSISNISTETIDTEATGTSIVDNIIRTGMAKRASDIHIEPLEKEIRVRYRIDGKLLTVAKVDKEKQVQIIGRLKAISNMHQEKQEPQDGRIIMYPDYNIRVSSQKNINGEKFVLRLLKKDTTIKGLFDLGYPRDPKLLRDAFDKRNSITVIAAPTGEGKTTTLYSVIDYLDKPEINITTIEDPVEIRIPGLNQIEIDPKTTFAGSLRTVLRQDPDIILVGEIRDQETAEIAMQAGQTGHYVLSTIHTLNAIEVVSRLRKMNISNYDISSTLATSISQRLVRKLCLNCRRERDFTEQEKEIITKIGNKYGVEFNLDNVKTFDAVGCEKCNNSGYYERIAIFETLLITDNIKELIAKDAPTIEIREEAYKEGYKPLVVDGLRKVVEGTTTLEELNSKLLIY